MDPASLRVRRGRRHDLPQVEALLGVAPDGQFRRLFARVVKDLRADLYVAEAPGGEIVGLVTLRYGRSLLRGGLTAEIDGVRIRRTPPGEVLTGLVAFAEARARRRGCRLVSAAIDPDDGDLRAVLLARGYRAGTHLVQDLAAEER